MVIDVLRASTTIVTALAHGAVAIMPRRTIDGARVAASAWPGALLGGERRCVRIDGFDLGNSPLEYTAARVGGRAIAITTTNGTAALAACHEATEVLVGAMVNRSVVAAAARQLAKVWGCHAVHLVCAGTDGDVSAEDVLTAGAILDAIPLDEDGAHAGLDAAAVAARDQFRALVRGERGDLMTRICNEFATSLGGENLIALGLQSDITAAAAIDALPVVPRLDRVSRSLRVAPVT